MKAARLPFLGEFAGAPEDEDAEGAAEGVDDDVVEGGTAAGDEALMDFVGAGVEEDHDDGPAGLAPIPRAGVFARVLAFGAPEEDGAEGVFRDVSAFAGDEDTGPHAFFGNPGQQPVNEGLQDARGTADGAAVGGAEKNQRHPQQRRQPEFNKEPESAHGAEGKRKWREDSIAKRGRSQNIQHSTGSAQRSVGIKG